MRTDYRFLIAPFLAAALCAQTVDCGGIAPWVATTRYPAGARVTYSGGLYRALVATTNVQPSYCPSCGWWVKLGTCGTSGTCRTVPGSPGGLAASDLTADGLTLSWLPVAAPANCAVSYRVYRNGAPAAVTTAARATLTGLAGNTTYSFTVAATDAAGASAPSKPLAVTTPAAGPVATTGTLSFHLLLGLGAGMDELRLDGDTYTDLILSNVIAGVMLGHLLQTYAPGLLFNKEYLYGSLLGQLLQENIATQYYLPGQLLIDPNPAQQAVMGVGQGGPYQINNYAVDMVTGSYVPGGYSLVNYVALQKNLGYTLASAATQHTRATPPSFNNKYFGPMLPAYFHYTDFVALAVTGKGPGGWTTPWQPAFDQAVSRFHTLPDNFLDMLLNAAYNQGFYGPLVSSYSSLGADATTATVARLRAYLSVWGSGDSYQQYPYQVMYYLDQLYDNPVPTTSATTFIIPGNHLTFTTATLEGIFAHVMETLAYVNGSGQYLAITAAQANAAFASALAQAGVPAGATLDLSTGASRAQVFKVLETALGGLETSLGMKFNATTSAQL